MSQPPGSIILFTVIVRLYVVVVPIEIPSFSVFWLGTGVAETVEPLNLLGVSSTIFQELLNLSVTVCELSMS